MARSQTLGGLLTLTTALILLGPCLWAAESGVTKTPDASGKFCHLKFPAITEDSLFTDRPVLKDPSQGDFIVIYAPCDYDPVGREAVLSQRAHRRQYMDQHHHSN